LSPSPFSSYPGQELDGIISQPPDIAADVSGVHNIEFVNDLGMYVWNKPTLPVPTPMPAPFVISNDTAALAT